MSKRTVEGISNRQVRRYVREAVERGWEVDMTNGGHVRLRHPNGAVVITTGTKGRGRGERNFLADLRRAEREAEGRG
jgi:hypothetical protein